MWISEVHGQAQAQLLCSSYNTKAEGLSLRVAPKGRGDSYGEAFPSSFPGVRSKVTQLHHSWAGAQAAEAQGCALGSS